MAFPNLTDYDPANFHKLPKKLWFAVTQQCNFRCFFCYRSAQEKYPRLDFELFKNFDKDALAAAEMVDMSIGGEPLLYPHFTDALSLLHGSCATKNVIRVTTNGSLASRKIGKLLHGRLHSMVFSLHAATEATYKKVTGIGNLHKTLARIVEMLDELDDDERKRVSAHISVSPLNIVELPKFVLQANKIGIPNVSIGPTFVKPNDFAHSLFSIRENFNDMLRLAKQIGEGLDMHVGGEYFFQNRVSTHSPAHCTEPFTDAFIDIQGRILPCCNLGDFIVPGNAFDDFKSLWFSQELHRLRRERHHPACRSCAKYGNFDSKEYHIMAHDKEKAEA